ncbi:MAG: amino acid permease [Acidobacteria bacterium]|nr:amino acid permease [Acidobacteriota bacterium]
MTKTITPAQAHAASEATGPPVAPPGQTGGPRGHGFGTAPVFLASISTILGAVMFLRFGYAVGHVGLLGAFAIILLGHLVTVPTALAIAEIATNRRVEGGGEYFIISRSFGATIGGAIGISLYLSQAISVAFYMIAFAEAARPLQPWIEQMSGMAFDPRMASVPGLVTLLALVLYRGADLGVKALWVVAGVLTVSLALFFLGSPVNGTNEELSLLATVEPSHRFMLVFAIVFPAFTGMTAGVGLSGDLARPRKSIPLGILSATLAGMVIYILIVLKLSASAPPEALASDQLIMSKIALWWPIIPLGLACATVSSAIGSVLVAPRTLQALAADKITPFPRVNSFLARGAGAANEPRNATVVTGLLALVTVAAGSVDFVARIISMFFMVTYGALCAISFLEHVAASPGYRPSFRSKAWVSLFGALVCLLLMFQMDLVYALLSIVLMAAIYRAIRYSRGGRSDDVASLFHGVMTQVTRNLHVKLQKSALGGRGHDWRPSIIMVNGRTFERTAPLQFFSWLSYRHGFGTYLHFIRGQLDPVTFRQSREILARLVEVTKDRPNGIYLDTMVSPSMRTALAQCLQVPGVAGMDNNTILFEFSRHDGAEVVGEVEEGCLLAAAARMNSLVLRHGDHFFGDRRAIHVWLTWHDYENVNLMILLSYILLGHPDWRHAEISVFAAYPQVEEPERRKKLKEMILSGRIPVTEKNIEIIPTDDRVDFNRLVEARSSAADLTVFGFTDERLREKGSELFLRQPALRETLFVSAQQQILIE